MELYSQDHDVQRNAPQRNATLLLASLIGQAARASENDAQVDNAEIENLLRTIRLQDPDIVGSPPASEEAISALEVVRVDSKELKKSCCSICTEAIRRSEKARKMPCADSHTFHEWCLFPWLRRHNSCPLCRHELKTDDPYYEEEKKKEARRETAKGMYNGMYN